MDSPQRPEEPNPLDELSPTLRNAVESVRRQSVPSDAQESVLRKLEETHPMRTNPQGSFWSRPSVLIAALAASVAIAFTAGFWTHATITPRSGETQVADNARHAPAPPAPGDPARARDTAERSEGFPSPEPATTADPRTTGVVNATVAPPTPVVPAEGTTSVTGSGPALPTVPGGPLGLGGGLVPSPQPFPGTPYPANPGYAQPLAPGGVPGPVPPPGIDPARPVAPQLPPPTSAIPSKKPAVPGEPKLGEVQDYEGKGKESGRNEPVGDNQKIDKLEKQLLAIKMNQAEVKKITSMTERLAKMPEGEARFKALEDGIKGALADLPADQKQAVAAALKAQLGGQQAGGEAFGTENYNHFVDNPYQAVQKAPLSTFSVSVDTASYANMRRFLTQENRLPPPDAVRIADMVNYFHYDYPQPKGADPVAFAMNMVNCPWNKEHQLLRVALAAKKFKAEDVPARNFVFLLDTSGSMSAENKLPLLKKALALLVEQMRAQDRVAIVAYAGSAGLVLPSTPGNEKEAILAALGKLESGGSTNGGQGIELAYKVAKENFIDGGVNRVILGTDGDFNVGTTSQGDLVRMIEEKRKTGVFLTILGFGYGNLKDHTMERLAHHGNGYFAYIDDFKEAKKVFVEQGGALMTVAKDVKLQLEFNPQRVAGYRLIGYENKLLRDEDFNNDAVDAGDMGSGHTVTALYEIIPAGKKVPNVEVDDLKYQTPKTPAEAANSGEFLTVKLRYKDPEKETSKKLEQPLGGAVEDLDKASEDLRFVTAVAEFGLLLRNSPYKGTANIGSVLEFAKSSLTKDEGGHRAEFVTLATKVKDLHAEIERQKEQQKKEDEKKP